jgi:hypothetical protein
MTAEEGRAKKKEKHHMKLTRHVKKPMSALECKNYPNFSF